MSGRCLGQRWELRGAHALQALPDRRLRAGDCVPVVPEPVLLTARAEQGLDLEGELRGFAGGELPEVDAR